MRGIKRNCFAYKEVDGIPQCNCLKGLYCDGCPFFTERTEVKNNIFYKESFKNYADYVEALNKYSRKYGIGHLEEFED